MRDHAEPQDIVSWPAGSEWLWRVDTVVTLMDGERLLAITRGETAADVVTRVVWESEVSLDG